MILQNIVLAKKKDFILRSPYIPKTNKYKGVIHCHSTNSDGHLSPTEVLNYYKGKGYHFASITEHIPNNVSSTSTITENPNVSGILFIKGYEHGYAKPTEPSPHIVELNPRPLEEILNEDGLTLRQEDSQTEINTALAYNDNGFIFLGHPNQSIRKFHPSDCQKLTGYNAISVYNNFEYYEELVDTVLSSGHDVLIVTEEDAHYYDGRGTVTEGKVGINVFADECTEEAILTSLRTGNYYSTTDSMDMTISIQGKNIIVSVGEASTIEFISRYGVIKQTNTHALSATYEVDINDLYVRIKATSDEWSKKAYSNPIWIEKL